MSSLRAARNRPIGLALLILLVGGCAGFSITDATQSRTQSETAIAAGYGNFYGFITVAYNDLTGTEGTISFPPGSRHVTSGASLMGWSYSTDRARTWRYGGKVLPSAEWPVLWGDPAITSSVFDPAFVFLSNLAAPQRKFPPGGISGPLFNQDGSSVIGGACIARSNDGGVRFALYQCVSTENFDFYDGGHMDSSIRGEIFAGYINMPLNRIDIWRSPGTGGQFALLPNPFPGLFMAAHPRLRVELVTGNLYVLAPDVSGTLFINRFIDGAWQQPRVAGVGSAIYPQVALSDRTLRTGPQYSFDVGAPFIEDPRDAVRVLYTVRDPSNGRLRLRGSMCYADLRNDCFDAPGWRTDLPGDQFSPNVRAWAFLWTPPAWKATFVSRDKSPSGNTVIVRIGDLVAQPDGQHGFPVRKLLHSQVVCPDLRGYWGDYHDLQHIGPDRGARFGQEVQRFLYSFSDSRAGCMARDTFISNHLHVLGVVE